MVANPDEIIEHSLSYCEECGSTLENVKVESCEARQVFDIPPVKLIVTEPMVNISVTLFTKKEDQKQQMLWELFLS